MRFFRRAGRRAGEAIGVAIFATLFAVFLLQVFFRYVLNNPLGWTDELAVLLYPWAVFWACAFLLAPKDHICFDVVYAAVRPPAQRVFAAIGLAVTAAVFLYALPEVIDYTRFMARERSAVLGIRMHWIFACFALFLAAFALRALIRLARLLGRGWQEHL